MSEKRKDHRGRVLKKGESQRKDRTYQYRYSDPFGKRRYVYADTLQELREKEAEIQRDLEDGIRTVRAKSARKPGSAPKSPAVCVTISKIAERIAMRAAFFIVTSPYFMLKSLL